MRVGENTAFTCQSIDGGRFPRAAGIQGGDVPDPHVVGEDVQDVGSRDGARGQSAREQRPVDEAEQRQPPVAVRQGNHVKSCPPTTARTQVRKRSLGASN